MFQSDFLAFRKFLTHSQWRVGGLSMRYRMQFSYSLLGFCFSDTAYTGRAFSAILQVVSLSDFQTLFISILVDVVRITQVMGEFENLKFVQSQ